MKHKAGDKAPGFALPDQSGEKHKLSDYKGHWVLIYFYPKDDTPGCTKEACALRDEIKNFDRAGVKVIGISVDSVKSHDKFARKHRLPFTLLADENRETVKTYDVWGRKKFMGREFDGTYRVSFLVDPQGKIAKVYEKVKPEKHAAEVLEDLSALAR